MWSTLAPGSAQEIASPGSALVTYDSDFINWPTLASKTGTTASSTFVYGAVSLAGPNAAVKVSPASIRSAYGVVQV